MTAISLRFSNVYGPRSYHKGSVVAEFFRQIQKGSPLTVYGDGTQTRDYVYVEDLVGGILLGMNSEESGVYQLGSGRGTSINELLELMKGAVGPEKPVNVNYEGFRDGEIRHTWCDISHACSALGYAPKTDLQDGLRKTWEWFCSQQ